MFRFPRGGFLQLPQSLQSFGNRCFFSYRRFSRPNAPRVSFGLAELSHRTFDWTQCESGFLIERLGSWVRHWTLLVKRRIWTNSVPRHLISRSLSVLTSNDNGRFISRTHFTGVGIVTLISIEYRRNRESISTHGICLPIYRIGSQIDNPVPNCLAV